MRTFRKITVSRATHDPASFKIMLYWQDPTTTRRTRYRQLKRFLDKYMELEEWRHYYDNVMDVTVVLTRSEYAASMIKLQES